VHVNANSAPSASNTNWSLLAQQGVPGVPGISGIEVRTSTVSVDATSNLLASAACSAGKTPISGGYSAAQPTVTASRSYPDTAAHVWRFQLVNTGAAPVSVTLYATCATAS
jgi:hypothetical protein